MPKSILATPCAMLLMLALSPIAAAQTCSRHSPSHTVALLELYTSEGCSSCPPADRFLAGLHNAGLSDEQVVPLALHVDYWDGMGWRDRFARHAFTERQRWLSALASSRIVYTPEFFLGGLELRNWQTNMPAAVRRINMLPARSDIVLSLGAADVHGLTVDVTARGPDEGRLYLVLYESGLSSRVAAGENQGNLLRHDYVVREWLGPLPLRAAGGAPLRRRLAIPPDAQRNRLGVAAFVQAPRGEVLQALALPVCGD